MMRPATSSTTMTHALAVKTVPLAASQARVVPRLGGDASVSDGSIKTLARAVSFKFAP
jgi:hypothetical protein